MRKALIAAIVIGILAIPGFAFASVSMTVSPTASVSWTLASSGANTKAAGSITVSATQAYQVTVSADKTRLTEYVTASSAYASNPKTLASALSILTTSAGGAGVPVSPVTAGTSASTIATGVGTVLTPATDSYAITLSQPTAITDPALPSGHAYHLVLTYTASATL